MASTNTDPIGGTVAITVYAIEPVIDDPETLACHLLIDNWKPWITIDDPVSVSDPPESSVPVTGILKAPIPSVPDSAPLGCDVVNVMLPLRPGPMQNPAFTADPVSEHDSVVYVPVHWPAIFKGAAGVGAVGPDDPQPAPKTTSAATVISLLSTQAPFPPTSDSCITVSLAAMVRALHESAA